MEIWRRFTISGVKPIEKAVEAAGGQAALAMKLSRSRAFVNQMVSGGRPVPVELRPAIELHTGVRCEEFGDEVQWVRDRAGKPTHFRTPVSTDTKKAAA